MYRRSQQFRVCGKHRGSSTNFCKYQILCQYRKRKGTLTGTIRTTEGIENAAYAQKRPVEDILADTEKSIFTLLQNQGGGDYVPIKDVVLNALEKIQLAAKTKEM